MLRLRTLWYLTFMLIVWSQISHQQDAQPSNRKIVKAIGNLETRIEEKLEVLLDDKLAKHLEKMIMPLHERFNMMEDNLKQIKQDVKDGLQELGIKTDQCRDARTGKQDCSDCLCHNGNVFCTNIGGKPEDQSSTTTISSAEGTSAIVISGQNLLDWADLGFLNKVNNALASGTDVNWQNSYGKTALHKSCSTSRNNPAIVRALLAAGADADLRDVDGKTPIWWASVFDKINVTNILIAHGADVNIPANDGKTPLIEAAERAFVSIVEALLGANADVKPTDKYGATALHWAVRYYKPAIVQGLLQAGADPMKQDTSGQTPIDNARSWGHYELADTMEG